MCLSTVDPEPIIPESNIGYKIMIQNPDGSLRNLFYKDRTYEVGKTYKDRKRRPI